MILAIGPDSDLRFDVAMRAYDYTPSVRADGPTWDDEEPGRPGGGADHFLDFIVAQAVPALAARAPLDPRRRTLCGALVRWFVRAARVVAPTAVLLALRGGGPLVVVAGRLHPARGRTPRPPAGGARDHAVVHARRLDRRRESCRATSCRCQRGARRTPATPACRRATAGWPGPGGATRPRRRACAVPRLSRHASWPDAGGIPAAPLALAARPSPA
ncbi:hypothetical protein D3C86_328770 [compost metagenome]